MRIIKEGIIPGSVLHRASCIYCKTEIEFEQREAKHIRDQREGNYLEIECPVCKKQITKFI